MEWCDDDDAGRPQLLHGYFILWSHFLWILVKSLRQIVWICAAFPGKYAAVHRKQEGAYER